MRSHVGCVMCRMSGAPQACSVSCDVRSRDCEA